MTHVYEVPAGFAREARINAERYAADYARSVREPEAFWGEVGRRLDWIVPYTQVKDVSFDVKQFRIRWYADGQLNVSANCLDRHLATRGDKTAILWEGDDPGESRHVTYRELHEQVCRFANVLKGLGVQKGDRITIYLPMIPEAAVAMLACTRIGAVHSIVFGGFSPESLATRIEDCASKLVITADEGLARRQESAAESQRRRRARPALAAHRRESRGGEAHRRERGVDRRAATSLTKN